MNKLPEGTSDDFENPELDGHKEILETISKIAEIIESFLQKNAPSVHSFLKKL